MLLQRFVKCGASENTSVETAASLINKTKMKPSFVNAKMVYSSIIRNDYRVLVLRSGDVCVTKTATAENLNTGKCCYKEKIFLSKRECEDLFSEKKKEKVYLADDKPFVESDFNKCDIIKQNLKILEEIVNKNLNNYKDFLSLKNSINRDKEYFNL